MFNSAFLSWKMAEIKNQTKNETLIDFHNSKLSRCSTTSRVRSKSISKDSQTTCRVIIVIFLLMVSITAYIAPYQSMNVLATSNSQQNSAGIPEASISSSNDLSSGSQSAKETEPFPDTNTCLPGQVEGPFGNCTDPICEPGQILEDHTCVNPPCPPGMVYNEDVGECVSEDFPPDTTCPDGSQGTIRDGPNGITVIECPLPNPDPNPNPKPGIDRGNIDIKDGVLDSGSNPNPNPKPGIDRGNIGNNLGATNQ